MTADNAVRVQRRFQELILKNPNTTLEEVKTNLDQRDYMDSHREISPLRMAEDALVLDNTYLSPEEQLQFAIKKVKEHTEAL
jgi:cytidylate kinase